MFSSLPPVCSEPRGRLYAATAPNLLQLRVDYTATSLIGTGERTMSGRLWRTRRRFATRQASRAAV